MYALLNYINTNQIDTYSFSPNLGLWPKYTQKGKFYCLVLVGKNVREQVAGSSDMECLCLNGKGETTFIIPSDH